MKEAEAALEEDEKATQHLEEKVRRPFSTCSSLLIEPYYSNFRS